MGQFLIRKKKYGKGRGLMTLADEYVCVARRRHGLSVRVARWRRVARFAHAS